MLLNHLQTPFILGKRKLKYFDDNKQSSQKEINQNEIISNNQNNRFFQNKKFIKYNKEILKNNIERYSGKNNNNGSDHKKNNFDPKSDKNINLNLQININNINFNNLALADKNNYSTKRAATLSGRFENKFKKENIRRLLEKEYEKEIIDIEPDENFIPEDFDIIKQIGEGTFGKIYCIEWPKNKKKYAMKKMILRTMKELNINQEKTNLVFNFIKKTNCTGVIRLYGDQCEQKNQAEYIYYVLMELASIDWENEIKKRSQFKKFYTEGELMEILNQLISSFALLQKNNITHRDIKPQNILIANNKYKICDFGEAKIIQTDGVIQQSIRGTELYMSPILFKALNSRQKMVLHNTYKSDVFSLGMCILLASTLTFQSLYDIRELDNMENVKNILVKYLIAKYSYNFVGTLLKMLEVNEDLRPDFIQLENCLRGF
jgi:tRNA A-37 threonylcarbamoyl transferase component Bud32